MDKVERVYDSVAKEYAEVFSDEHEKKPKDQEILQRFAWEANGFEKIEVIETRGIEMPCGVCEPLNRRFEFSLILSSGGASPP